MEFITIYKKHCLTLHKSSILTASLLIRSIRTIFFSITPPVALNAVSIGTAKLFCWTSGWTRCYICTTSFIWRIRTVFISITSPAHWNALLICTSKLVWTTGFGSWHWEWKIHRNWGTIYLNHKTKYQNKLDKNMYLPGTQMLLNNWCIWLVQLIKSLYNYMHIYQKL